MMTHAFFDWTGRLAMWGRQASRAWLARLMPLTATVAVCAGCSGSPDWCYVDTVDMKLSGEWTENDKVRTWDDRQVVQEAEEELVLVIDDSSAVKGQSLVWFVYTPELDTLQFQMGVPATKGTEYPLSAGSSLVSGWGVDERAFEGASVASGWNGAPLATGGWIRIDDDSPLELSFETEFGEDHASGRMTFATGRTKDLIRCN
jgi:hypothetical protein